MSKNTANDMEHMRRTISGILFTWEQRIINANRDIDNLKAQVEQWHAVAESRQREIEMLTDGLVEANRLLREYCRESAAAKKGR